MSHILELYRPSIDEWLSGEGPSHQLRFIPWRYWNFFQHSMFRRMSSAYDIANAVEVRLIMPGSEARSERGSMNISQFKSIADYEGWLYVV